MEWNVPEHVYRERTNDWFAAVFVIAAVLIAAELYFSNYVVIVLIILATCGVLIVAKKQPKIVHVAISKTGVKLSNVFYPFSELDAFAIIDHPTEHKILLESNKTYLPLIIIPIPDEVDRESVFELLAKSLPHKEMREPFAHVISDYLGF
jgi:uncharacterized membrane protein YobD (UPF0266 family)